VSRDRVWLVVALVADLLGASGILLVVGRTWQRASVIRQAPLPAAIVHLSGRDLQAALGAFALIALAGVVAIPATRGFGRRIVGAALAASGVVVVWRALISLSPASAARVRAAVASGVGVDTSSRPRIDVMVAWPLATAGCGMLIALAGVLTVIFAARWSAMAGRYEAPTAAARRERPATDTALWAALDRGEDPTTRTGS
jgi:uncharacterized membrane protein (TIGR02234 family)